MYGTLLLVSTDQEYLRRVDSHLHLCDIECRVFSTVTDNLQDMPLANVDAVLFDIDDTAEPLRLIRSFRAAIADRVLLTCARKEVGVEVVLAYEGGADDFFGKSTDLMIVEAKVRRAFRRRQCQSPANTSSAPPAERAEAAVMQLVESELTRIEYRLLKTLADSTGGLVTSRTILERIWGRGADPKLLYEHISTLRSKLLTAGWTIANVRGAGYRLEPPPAELAERPSQVVAVAVKRSPESSVQGPPAKHLSRAT
jgi:DNA-binding response OmpR family regulator